MKNYRMLIQYEGTRYNGWQRQGNTQNTIQGRLESVLSRLTGAEVQIQGSGRTDAGVHALGQTANVLLPEGWHISGEALRGSGLPGLDDLPGCEALRRVMNHYLPEDIDVTELEEAPERFHSRLSAAGKTYQYRIGIDDYKNIEGRQFRYRVGRPLDVEAMGEALGALRGTHDFAAFCGNPRMKKSTVRTISAAELEEVSHEIRLRITGNGFLQNMVRIIVGTLLEIGLGSRPVSDMKRILDSRDRSQAGPAAPAGGLCLLRVYYD